MNYVLLRPVSSSPRSDQIICLESVSELEQCLAEIPAGDVLAFDFETTGLQVYRDDFRAVSLGISCSLGSAYLDLNPYSTEQIKDLLLKLNKFDLIAHNAYFDGQVFYKYTGQHANLKACTYGYARQLATEGWFGQQYSLKRLQIELLGWPESNEKELDQWLIEHGYIKGTKKDKPNKAEMWRAPNAVLGPYNALDADATYQLYTQVILPALGRLTPISEMYHEELFLPNVKILIEATLTGIRLDLKFLTDYHLELITKIEQLKNQFYALPTVSQLINEWHTNQLAVLEEKQPEMYLKQKVVKEPTKFKKDGTISKNWLRYKEKLEQPMVVSKNWIKWEKKFKEAESDPYKSFNINSGQQLTWLFYERLYKYEVIKEHFNEHDIGQIKLYSNGKEYELDMTDSGGLPTDEDALLCMGEEGKVLNEYKLWFKLLGYVKGLQDLEYKGRYHPIFKCPGTMTGRLGGDGGFNIQTLPKTDLNFLKVFIPDDGYVFVNCDVTSLENVVLAEMSQDPYLLGLYGPDANPNHDAYLYLGLSIPSLRDKIIKAGYDPINPTKEGVSNAKKECKKIRDALKVVILSGNYGASALKMYKTLKLKGFDFTYEEIKAIHKGRKDAMPGVARLQRELEHAWAENNGWVFNPLGRPVGVDHRKKKDLINQVTQSGGHDAMMALIIQTRNLFEQNGIQYKWAIPDFHDDTIPQVHVDQAEQAKRIMDTLAYKDVNEWLSGTIPLKGVAAKAFDLKGIKSE
jgi:DNA polymerase I-like protein with 3'-5' exonuclease and polymerase domains